MSRFDSDVDAWWEDHGRFTSGRVVERICRRCREPFPAQGAAISDPDPWCEDCLREHTPPDRVLTCRECGTEFYVSWNEVHPDRCGSCLHQRITRTAEMIGGKR